MEKVKAKLASLYNSSKPQVFSQLHCDIDEVKGKIWTSTSRIYDLRASAVVQILFADGLTTQQAKDFLKAAIEHLEMYGLPEGSPKAYPDGTTVEENQ
jgi:hypothetical protein